MVRFVTSSCRKSRGRGGGMLWKWRRLVTYKASARVRKIQPENCRRVNHVATGPVLKKRRRCTSYVGILDATRKEALPPSILEYGWVIKPLASPRLGLGRSCDICWFSVYHRGFCASSLVLKTRVHWAGGRGGLGAMGRGVG